MRCFIQALKKCRHYNFLGHNIIKIHSINMWDQQYSMEYSPHSYSMWKNIWKYYVQYCQSHKTLFMDLKNIMVYETNTTCNITYYKGKLKIHTQMIMIIRCTCDVRRNKLTWSWFILSLMILRTCSSLSRGEHGNVEFYYKNHRSLFQVNINSSLRFRNPKAV
jgi:hypothetical protein